MLPRLGSCALALAMVAGTAACELPRDPDNTLRRVAGGVMRVGATEAPPWVVAGEDGTEGVDIDLVLGFAASLNARVARHHGSEEQLLEAVEAGELDLVVGGLSTETPWVGRVQLTRPYAVTRILVAVPVGVPVPPDLDGVRVAAEAGTRVPRLVRDAGGIPLRVRDLARASGPVAGDEWQIRDLGLVPTHLVLAEERHVMAINLGENGFGHRLDRYLHGVAEQVRVMLERAAPA
ncbi:MAG: ABC transporter substrate-binding protein [Actinomycetota bacterium]|nr:ABC transporter substrate-binding protein [Actinomycetota bacterium]